jgi:hypothetical protein
MDEFLLFGVDNFGDDSLYLYFFDLFFVYNVLEEGGGGLNSIG